MYGDNQSQCCPCRCPKTEHPHVYGDNAKKAGALLSYGVGTPPCVWGQLAVFLKHFFFVLGTPPCVWGQHATKALRFVAAAGTPPCVWGQRGFWLGVQPPSCGTPPCVWGQPCTPRRCILGRIRNTPMCMGTTAMLLRSQATRDGTPPCVWGQPQNLSAASLVLIRNTPMCMGTTVSVIFVLRVPVAEHPHVYGDNPADLTFDQLSNAGTPPCVWGQPHNSSRRFDRPARNTPMCMGTTSQRLLVHVRRPLEHPHVYGDNTSIIPEFKGLWQVWGRLCLRKGDPHNAVDRLVVPKASVIAHLGQPQFFCQGSRSPRHLL